MVFPQQISIPTANLVTQTSLTTSLFQPLNAPIINGDVTVVTHSGTNEVRGNPVPEPATVVMRGFFVPFYYPECPNQSGIRLDRS